MSYYILDTFTYPRNIAMVRDRWRALSGIFSGTMRLNLRESEWLPIEFELEQPQAGDTIIAAGYVATMCLFSDELLDILYRVGVDNLDVYPALLRNNLDDEEIVYKNYKAVVIMGAIGCVDKKRSGKLDLGDGSGLIDGGVDKMYIDERKADGLLMFRPQPGMGAVVVHERVKTAIQAAKLPGLRFYDPSKFGGF